MILWLKLGTAVMAAISFFAVDHEAIVKSGDLDAAATVLVMILLIGYILGAKIGKIMYWVIAVYLLLKIAW